MASRAVSVGDDLVGCGGGTGVTLLDERETHSTAIPCWEVAQVPSDKTSLGQGRVEVGDSGGWFCMMELDCGVDRMKSVSTTSGECTQWIWTNK